jgi:pimeloyl-ACP methyl ester carboxylesterase
VASPIWVSTDDGCKLAAYDFGGTGEPVLFMHATGFHAHLWLPVIHALGDRFHCYAFDQRGHGASPSPPNRDFGWRRMGEDARQVAAELGLSRPKAVGHSGGAAHLILSEQDHHGTWARLWTFEPVIRNVESLPPLPADANPMTAAALRRRDHFASRKAAYRNFASKQPFASFTPEALSIYVEHGFADAPDGGVTLACSREDEAAMYANAMAPGAFERLPEVEIPVHIACGRDSTHFTEDVLGEVTARLPDASLEVVDGLGHFGPFEAPERVAASIRAALG